MTSVPKIVCPVDYLPLEESNGKILCKNGHQYQIRGGIPRMTMTQNNYAEAFGEQWIRYQLTQLDSYTKTTITRDRLRRCLGDVLWRSLEKKRTQPLKILEVGCGAGRFTEVLLEMPGAHITSTDLSSAVEANQNNFMQTDRHRIVQCDINQMPFRPEQYDIVICLGVIQHTKVPERTIADLYKQVIPGGWLVMDHYTYSVSHYTKITSLALRQILKRLPPKQGVLFTEKIVWLIFPLHRAVKNKRMIQMFLSRLSPLVTYFKAYPQLDNELQYQWALLDTHDALTDYYKHLRTAPQIYSIISKLGAKKLWIEKGGNGIEARCQKPCNR